MQAWFDRLVANAGSALTVGGTVLAVGLGFGAVGLAEKPAVGQFSPWSNWWFVIGLVLALLGLVWVLATFIAAMMVTTKSERFRAWLGEALLKGQDMLAHPPLDNPKVEAWATE